MNSQQTPDTSDPDKWHIETIKFRKLNRTELINVVGSVREQKCSYTVYQMYKDPQTLIQTTMFFITYPNSNVAEAYWTTEDLFKEIYGI